MSKKFYVQPVALLIEGGGEGGDTIGGSADTRGEDKNGTSTAKLNPFSQDIIKDGVVSGNALPDMDIDGDNSVSQYEFDKWMDEH